MLLLRRYASAFVPFQERDEHGRDCGVIAIFLPEYPPQFALFESRPDDNVDRQGNIDRQDVYRHQWQQPDESHPRRVKRVTYVMIKPAVGQLGWLFNLSKLAESDKLPNVGLAECD